MFRVMFSQMVKASAKGAPMAKKLSQEATIMIVDDTPANLQLLLQVLLKNGHRVVAFTDSAQALGAAKNHPPDIILLDIRMPGMDGLETCRRLKADPELRDVPVLFISMINEPDKIVQAFAAGGADYVTKPFQPEEVLARVSTHLQLRRLLSKVKRQRDAVEKKVSQRTRELEQKNASLAQYIHQLEKTNVALDVLIRKFDAESTALAQKTVDELWMDIAPMLRELNELCSSDEQKVLVEMIQSRLAQAEPKIPRLEDNQALLSKREQEVALLIAEGRSCTEVGQLLSIALRSVHSHCYSIRKKLGVPGKVNLKTFLINRQ